MDPTGYEDEVTKGIALLDEKGPAGWREKVRIMGGRIQPSHMMSVQSCVLGRVYGSVYGGTKVLREIDDTKGRGDWMTTHGFASKARTQSPSALLISCVPLAQEWNRRLGL